MGRAPSLELLVLVLVVLAPRGQQLLLAGVAVRG